jgi:hypothetical protein
MNLCFSEKLGGAQKASEISAKGNDSFFFRLRLACVPQFFWNASGSRRLVAFDPHIKQKAREALTHSTKSREICPWRHTIQSQVKLGYFPEQKSSCSDVDYASLCFPRRDK